MKARPVLFVVINAFLMGNPDGESLTSEKYCFREHVYERCSFFFSGLCIYYMVVISSSITRQCREGNELAQDSSSVGPLGAISKQFKEKSRLGYLCDLLGF